MIAVKGTSNASTKHIGKAADRNRQVKHLVHAHPELAPASFLLSDFAQTSEVIDEVTACHEPMISELLAFGEAIDTTKDKWGLRTVSIIALVAGAAGELVKIVRLTHKQLALDGQERQLDCMTAKGGEDSLWMGNGSPVQQLVFAEVEGKPGHWLAVRYHGAISIFRPLLKSEVDLSVIHENATSPLSSSCLDINCVVMLSEQNGAEFSDVSFNPWNNQQLGTVDQQGHWVVWDIEASLRPKQKGHGAISKHSEGHISEDHMENPPSSSLVADGWTRVLWVGTKLTIAVANRRRLAFFNTETRSKLPQIPDLGQKRDGDWLLDLKRSPMRPHTLFVVTSSSVCLLHISTAREHDEPKDVELSVSIMLSWKHFRNRDDLSLRLNVLDVIDRPESDSDTTSVHAETCACAGEKVSMVLLHSRFNNVITNFTFHSKSSSSQRFFSAADPYLLQLEREDNRFHGANTKADVLLTHGRIATMVFKTVDYHNLQISPSDLSEEILKTKIDFYQLSILQDDGTLSEALYAELDVAATVPPYPISLETRKHILKTPAKISDDFIVPDGVNDLYYESPGHILEKQYLLPSPEDLEEGPSYLGEDPLSLNLEWLEIGLRSALSVPSPALDETLEFLNDKFKEHFKLENTPSDTLSNIINKGISVNDVEKATTDFADFLEDVARSTSGPDDDSGKDEGKRIAVSRILEPAMQRNLGLGDSVQLSDIYDSLIKVWMAPLSGSVPGRTRIALERVLRHVVVQICLASHRAAIDQGVGVSKQAIHGETSVSHPSFVLPVRRRVSTTQLKKRSQAATRPSSPVVPTHAFFNDGSLQSSSPPPQLTPDSISFPYPNEPASSLVESEDMASLRIKAFAKLEPQPALPVKMLNLLDHWEVGADPALYDWEAAQQTSNNEDESENETRAMQRQRYEKRQKRQRRNSAQSLPQPPKRLEGDPPQPAQETQTSNPHSQDIVSQSQVERGLLGGRAAQTKKKKRTRGF